MVRSVSAFAAFIVTILALVPFLVGSYDVDSQSTVTQCIERLTQRGRDECVISEPILATTRGAATITAPIFGGTLPTTRKIDLTIRFEGDGCLIWNHLSAAPQAGDPANTVTPIDILRITAPEGLVSGSRLRIENACVRHLTDGVEGGQTANRIVGIAIRGDGAGNLSTSTNFAPTTTLSGGSTVWTNAIGLRVDGEAGGMSNGYATPETLDYLSRLKRFEGLDPSIPWSTYYIDPYNGSDSNEGSYQRPFRTLSTYKALSAYGVRFFVKNKGRARPVVFANQTFPFPSGETCVPDEIVSYTGGTSKVLDVDYAAGVIVFETISGNRIVATTAITSGTVSGTNCSFTVGTRTPTLWDGTTYLCQTDNTRTCSSGNRGTTTGCTSPGAGVCSASIEAGIALKTTPTRFDGRIVSYIDVEDPSIPFRIAGDGRTSGDLDNAAQAAGAGDRNGLFIARNDLSHGCIGVANVIVDKIGEDIITNHEEGCVRALNVYADRVWNESNTKNNNVITTHTGTAGRGGVASVNGGGSGWRYDSSAGATIAPTGSAHMILINGSYAADFTNWAGGNASASPFEATGGKIAAVKIDTLCTTTSTAVAGCFGYTVTSTDSPTTFHAARITARDAKNDAIPAISLVSGGNTLKARFYRLGIRGGRGIQLQSFGTGLIDLVVRGGLFDELNAAYIMDFSTSSAFSTVDMQGVYDDVTAGYYFDWDATKTYNTAAAARAVLPASWHFLDGDWSVLTSAVEYESGFNGRCSQAAGTRCFDTYAEQWDMPFPVPLYDYLPTPIRGYSESGTRSYGAN